jgi:hypothetical protein
MDLMAGQRRIVVYLDGLPVSGIFEGEGQRAEGEGNQAVWGCFAQDATSRF